MVSRGLTGVIISCFAARPLYLLSFSCREKTFSDRQFLFQIPWKCNFFTNRHLARGHVALPSRQRDQPCPQTETEYNYHYSFLMSLLHCLMTRCLAGLPYILESTQINFFQSNKNTLPQKICSLPFCETFPLDAVDAEALALPAWLGLQYIFKLIYPSQLSKHWGEQYACSYFSRTRLPKFFYLRIL